MEGGGAPCRAVGHLTPASGGMYDDGAQTLRPGRATPGCLARNLRKSWDVLDAICRFP